MLLNWVPSKKHWKLKQGVPSYFPYEVAVGLWIFLLIHPFILG